MNEATQILEPFVGQWAVLLTTYKRDGTPVGTQRLGSPERGLLLQIAQAGRVG